jgi:hypothetical protein
VTLDEFFFLVYAWSDVHALELFCAALALPVVGTLAAWIGRGGKTDADGRLIASAVMAVPLAAVVIEVLAIGIAVGLKNQTIFDANVLLLVGPIFCLVGCVLGIRRVFPLNELGSVKSAFDVSAFVIACLAMMWLFSKFRGWSLVFFGSFGQLMVVGLFAALLLWRLYKRAFGRLSSSTA